MPIPKFKINDWVTFKGEAGFFYISKVKMLERSYIQTFSYYCKYYNPQTHQIETTSLAEEDLLIATASPKHDAHLYAHHKALTDQWKHLTPQQIDDWENFCKALKTDAKGMDFSKLK